MGRKLTASEETALLQQTIKAAHEATQALNDAIRQATRLAPQLVSDFEDTHRREIELLSNYMTAEANRHAAALNAEVEQARRMINDQIMSGKAVFNRHTSTVTITWGPGSFNDSQPPPYPLVAQREDTT